MTPRPHRGLPGTTEFQAIGNYQHENGQYH